LVSPSQIVSLQSSSMRRRNPSSNSPSKSHAFHAKEIPSTQN